MVESYQNSYQWMELDILSKKQSLFTIGAIVEVSTKNVAKETSSNFIRKEKFKPYGFSFM